jgi:hypothetical protein
MTSAGQQPDGAVNSPMKKRSDPKVIRTCVPQPFALSIALVRNWSLVLEQDATNLRLPISELKLTHCPARSPLPIAALPSVSPIPSARLPI